MYETFARQGSDNVHAFAEESVAKTRESYRKMDTFAKDGAKALRRSCIRPGTCPCTET
jgi:hypothetical protein